MTAAALLELKSVSKHFSLPSGTIAAINNVNVSVSQGEFFALSGPSGSGKTTLLMLAALLDRPSTGKIIFDGRDTSSLDEPELSALRAHYIGMIFQNYYLLPRRTVLQNVVFRFRYMPRPPQKPYETASHALELVGLGGFADRPAGLLSGGEMQRVAIARAIAVGPKLLAADEPTGNLDAESAHTVMECLARLNALGTTIMLVTHNDSLLHYAGRCLRCSHGTLENGN